MNNDLREVDFHTYCALCEYKDTQEEKDPCHQCLAHPANINSVKPVKYKEKK